MIGGSHAVEGLEGLEGLADEALRGLVEEIGATVQRDSVAAGERLGAVVAVARDRGLSDVVAAGSYLQARAELNVGHLESALALIDVAESSWQHVGARANAVRTQLGKMHVLGDMGRHSDAIEVGERVVAALRAGDLDEDDPELRAWLEAAAQENLGVSYGFLGQHHEALAAYARAEAVYIESGWDDDVVRPLGNRGVELVELGHMAEAVEALSAAADAFDGQGNELWAAKCRAYLARAALGVGDYAMAAEQTEAAEFGLRGQDTTTEFARTQLVRAATLASLNLTDRAERLYADMLTRFEAAGLRHDLAAARLGHADVLANMGASKPAQEAYLAAELLFSDIGDTAGRALAAIRRSEILPADQARDVIAGAIQDLDKQGQPVEFALAMLRMADLEPPGSGDADLALRQAADVIAERQLGQLEWRLAHQRAEWFRAAGDPANARVHYEAAIDALDAIRATVSDEFHRIPFMERRRQVHEGLIGMLISAGDVTAASRWVAQARSRSLFERIRGHVVASAPEVSPEVDAAYSALLEAPGALAGAARADAKSAELSAPVRRAQHRVGSEHRVAGDREPVTVVFDTIGDDIFAFTEVDGEVEVRKCPMPMSAVTRTLARLEMQWARFEDAGLSARRPRQLRAATLDLLQQLYVGLSPAFDGGLTKGRLAVTPIGPLANVPFAALHDGVSHLLEYTTVVLGLTAGVAASRRPMPDVRRLVVAVPDSRAPGIAAEGLALADLAGSSLLAGDDASVATVAEGMGRADVAHFACHGLHRPDNPVFSALKLGDGWLTAAQIMHMRLSGQLVVLSACDSGRQVGAGAGDELIGLPRALIGAGAGGVVVNLWRADDNASVKLMKSFHDQLRTLPPPEALRAAQLEVMDEDPHPYRWAPAAFIAPPSQEEAIT